MAKRLFRVDTSIHGGELVIGTVNEEFVQHFIDEDESELMTYVLEAEDIEPEDLEGPEICDEFYTWSETDDIEHLYGVYANTEWSWMEVTGTEGRDSYDDEYEGEKFEPLHLHDREAYHEDNDERKEEYDVVPCLLYHTMEKGGMGNFFIETDGEDFDPNKFCYSTVATNVAEIVDQVWYDKQLIDCDMQWCDTRSKGDYVQVGWFNKDWHDTREQRLADEYMWESYDENIEDARQEELKRSILVK
jgi:hypothetical protein